MWNAHPQLDETVTWSGECGNGKAQGQGRQAWSFLDQEGNRKFSSYEGMVRDGRPEKQGTFVLSDGSRYDGQWKDGKENGHGVYQYTDGARYDGQWKEGNRSGKGLMVYSDGGSYRGMFVNDKEHGIGDCVAKDGSSGKCEFSYGTFIRWLQ